MNPIIINAAIAIAGATIVVAALIAFDKWAGPHIGRREDA